MGLFFGGYMALVGIGDIHGNVRVLSGIVDAVNDVNGGNNDLSCIQVGDLGFKLSDLVFLQKNPLKKRVYFVDGNHEYFQNFYHLQEVSEIAPNLFYVPRGTVMELDGRVVAFLGGASSIDKADRLKNGWHWDAREDIQPEERDRLFENLNKMGNPKVDLLVTHIPPNWVIRKYFDPMTKLDFGVPVDWTDPNGVIVEDVWNRLDKPAMICGHMHRDIQFAENAYILDIYQVRYV
jgi:UDP-2,3-diacylglucosamine pyrophosphatase LpxH